MTTRLKILSIGLAFSIIYAVYDWYDRNNIGSSKTKQVVSKKNPKAKIDQELQKRVEVEQKIELLQMQQNKRI